MSIWGKIGHAIAKPFILLAHAIWGVKGLAALATATEEMLKTEFGQVVLLAVSNAQALAKNDPAGARQSAFDEIKAALVKAGTDVKDSVINLAIEMMVQHVKGLLGS